MLNNDLLSHYSLSTYSDVTVLMQCLICSQHLYITQVLLADVVNYGNPWKHVLILLWASLFHTGSTPGTSKAPCCQSTKLSFGKMTSCTTNSSNFTSAPSLLWVSSTPEFFNIQLVYFIWKEHPCREFLAAQIRIQGKENFLLHHSKTSLHPLSAGALLQICHKNHM